MIIIKKLISRRTSFNYMYVLLYCTVLYCVYYCVYYTFKKRRGHTKLNLQWKQRCVCLSYLAHTIYNNPSVYSSSNFGQMAHTRADIGYKQQVLILPFLSGDRCPASRSAKTSDSLSPQRQGVRDKSNN